MAVLDPAIGDGQPKRCSSGITGLDDILGGGVPEGQMYLIRGDPGAGKTTFAMQFMMEGARRGEKCLYVTLAENTAELQQVAASHGWSLAGVEILELAGPDPETGDQPASTFFHAWETELARLRRKLMEKVGSERPVRLVFDSLAEIRTVADSPYHFRQQIAPLPAGSITSSATSSPTAVSCAVRSNCTPFRSKNSRARSSTKTPR